MAHGPLVIYLTRNISICYICFIKIRQPEGDCKEFKAKLNGEIHIISFLGNFIVNVYRYDS